MPAPFLHTASSAYDLRAIMCRTWTHARGLLVWHVKTGTTSSSRSCYFHAIDPEPGRHARKGDQVVCHSIIFQCDGRRYRPICANNPQTRLASLNA